MAATQRQWIFTGLTALRHLQVHDNHNIRTELEQLQLPAQLSTLDLRVTTGSAMIGPSLRSFNLTQYYNPNLPFLAMVCKLPLLKFSIGDMNMSRVLPMLTALTTLTALRLANTNISSTRNLTCLLVLTRLISLQLDISTGPFFEHLSALTNLRMLTFTQEGVGQKSTRPDIPIDALPRLPSLYLLSIRSEGHNAWRFDVSSLTNVTSIRMLELHEHFLDPPDLTPLTSLRNLHFLRLRESSPPPCGLEVSVLPLLAPLSGLSWVMLSGFSEEITKAAEARYPATKFWSVPQFRFSG